MTGGTWDAALPQDTPRQDAVPPDEPARSEDPREPQDLIAELCRVGRSLVERGLVLGSGGNLSARPPGGAHCVVTAAGTWLDELTPSGFSLVRIADGAVVAGNPTPSSEVALHLASYRVRPDVNAVVHVHPQHAVLVNALGWPIRLLTTDHVYYVRRVRATAYHHPGTRELALAAAELIADGECDCVILARHGCSVVADSVELAHKRVMNLEEAALATYRALLLGDRDTGEPPGYAERLRTLEAGRH